MLERFRSEKQKETGLAIGTRYAVTYLHISCPIVYEIDHTFASAVRRYDSYALAAPEISNLYTVVEYIGDGRYLDLVSNIEFRPAVVEDDILDTVTQSYEEEARAIHDDLIETPISISGIGFVELTPEIRARILYDTLPRSEEIVSALEQVQNISRVEIEKFYEKLNRGKMHYYYNIAQRENKERDTEAYRLRQEELRREEEERQRIEALKLAEEVNPRFDIVFPVRSRIKRNSKK